MIPIGAPVTATMPGGEKTNGIVEEVDKYMGETMYLIRDGHDFDYKWFRDGEVKIRLNHRTISCAFTLWQLNALIGYPANSEWNAQWDGDLFSDIYEYFNMPYDKPIINKLIRYDMPAPFTLWALNTEYLCTANASWIGSFSDDLNPKSIYNYRLYMGISRFKK